MGHQVYKNTKMIILTIQLLFGCQGLLVRLVLHKGVTLQETCPSVQVQVNVLQ